MKTLLLRLFCFFAGHPCLPTGRHGLLLTEYRCTRCGRLYLGSSEYPGRLLPADQGSDRIFRDGGKLLP
jgi:hypothetical protein